MSTAAVILAAGKGTRMKSDLPKVLHDVAGRPMVGHVIDRVRGAGIRRVVLVIGYRADDVRAACADDDVEFVLQEEQLGTGHAVMQAESLLQGFEGTLLVLNGDVPCLRVSTIDGFREYHETTGAAATVLTAVLEDPTGYGRIVKSEDGNLQAIVEQKDADDEVRAIREINSGLFCFDKGKLFDILHRTDNQNAQNEYYLTDAIQLLREKGELVQAYCVNDDWEVSGVNTDAELEAIRGQFDERT